MPFRPPVAYPALHTGSTDGYGQLKILVADDAAILRRRLVGMLSALNGVSKVIESVDCATTLASVDENLPDVLVLDLCLPDGSGLDVLQKLKQLAKMPRVFILTTWSDPEVRKRCLAAGAEQFFEKSSDVFLAVDTVGAIAAETGK